MKHIAVALAAMLAFAAQAEDAAKAKDAKSVHAFTVEDIEGKKVDLSDYEGKVLLIVNVASKCGFTPQYEQLQELHERYHDQGLRILGFPANNFGGQEPGTDAEIATFCRTTYGVDFDMFSKISVKGDDIAPVYAWLTDEKRGEDIGGEITWNFNKFLVNDEGEVIARFDSKVKPDDEQVTEAIEKALEEAESGAEA